MTSSLSPTKANTSLPEIVSFSTDRNNRSVSGAAQLPSKTSASQKFVIGNTNNASTPQKQQQRRPSSYSVVTSPLLDASDERNNNFSIADTVNNKTDLLNSSSMNSPNSNNTNTKKIATTLGSIACTLQRQHEKERRVADINDVRGAIPVPVSKSKAVKRSKIDQGKNNHDNTNIDTVSDDERDATFEAMKNKFDQSVSLEVRRLLITSQQQQKRKRQQNQKQMMMKEQQQHHQAAQSFGEDEEQFMAQNMKKKNLEKALDESSHQFLEAISSSPQKQQQQQQKTREETEDVDFGQNDSNNANVDHHDGTMMNQQQHNGLLNDDDDEEEEEEFVEDDNDDDTNAEEEELMMSPNSSSKNNNNKNNYQLSHPSSSSTGTGDATVGKTRKSSANYSRPSSYTSSTRIITSADQKTRETELMMNDSSSIIGQNYQQQSSTSQQQNENDTSNNDSSLALISNDGAENSSPIRNSMDHQHQPSSVDRFMNTFGEPRAEKMALFQNASFKNPLVTRTTPIRMLQGRSSHPQQRQQDSPSRTTRAAIMKTSFGHDHDEQQQDLLGLSSQPAKMNEDHHQHQEESPLSRQRRRFETLRYKNELSVADSSFKSPSAAQYSYKRNFQCEPAPPAAAVKGTFTQMSHLEANKRGGVPSNDGTFPLEEAGKAVNELLHPTFRARKGSWAMLQTEEGKKQNDSMAEMCIIRRSLTDDTGRPVTIWPSVSVLGAGMRNDGKRLGATLKKFRSELAKTEKSFWSSHPTPPRRASLIEKQIAMQRRKQDEEAQQQQGKGSMSSSQSGRRVGSATAKRWSRPSSSTSSTNVFAKEDGDFGYRPVLQ